MFKRTDLVQQIQAEIMDHRKSLSNVLRRVVALGGETGSAELRDWASKELSGYPSREDLPEYRRVPAPLLIDAATHFAIIKGQQISSFDFPDVAQDSIPDAVPITMGIRAVERLVADCRPGESARLAPPGGAELVKIMNLEGHFNGTIERIYWGVSPVALEEVLDQVRNKLITMLAEMRALTGSAEIPSAEVADRAVQFIVSGKRNSVTISNNMAGGNIQPAAPDEASHGRSWKLVAPWSAGIVALAGAIFGFMQVQGLKFPLW
ncbi:AbiTii domain-containing protein [Kineosporia babensis]|uniref:AbiTii domain-containing protein n=1 Tax=Kineosporia babensis TaxID=499548 RepID=A0A9X1NLS2_9ACTN|nr:hypothetical protein [Kineosporia babensis]